MDTQSGMFFEPKSDFYYDPTTKLYFGIQQKAYFKYNPRESPPFEKVHESQLGDSDTRDLATNTTSKTEDSSTKKGERKRSGSTSPIPPHLNASQKQDMANIAMWSKMQQDAKAPDDEDNQKVSLPMPSTIVVRGEVNTHSTNDHDAKASDTSLLVKHQHSSDDTKMPEPDMTSTVVSNSSSKELIICEPCRRKFKSLEALRSHEERSQMHKDRMKELSSHSIGSSSTLNATEKRAAVPGGTSHEHQDSRTGDDPSILSSTSNKSSNSGRVAATSIYQDRAEMRRAMHQRSDSKTIILPGSTDGVEAEVVSEKILHSDDKTNVGYQLYHKMLDKSASSMAITRTTSTGASVMLSKSYEATTTTASNTDVAESDDVGSGDKSADDDKERDRRIKRKAYMDASTSANHKRLRKDWDDMQVFIDHVTKEDK